MLLRLFNILAAFSLLLCMAIGAIWTRSVCTTDRWKLLNWIYYGVSSSRGSIQLQFAWCESAPGKYVQWKSNDARYHDQFHFLLGQPDFDFQPSQPLRPKSLKAVNWQSELPWAELQHSSFYSYGTGATYWFRKHRFGWEMFSHDINESGYVNRVHIGTLLTPYWALTVCSGLLPVIWLGRLLRLKRQQDVHACAICGYDLRATPQRCPECAAIPARPLPLYTSPQV